MSAPGDRRGKLPAIGKLLARPPVVAWIGEHGRDAVVDVLRAAVASARDEVGTASEEAILASASASLLAARRGTLVPVLNATGVVLHTNLGRAPLGAEAIAAIAGPGSGYSSLELDLGTGARGSRHSHAAERLRRLTRAQDALVTNNAAAALLLALSALARGAPVIVSRGELIEIGGAFRIPDIVRTGGASLLEVGTTNRTRIDDYRRALDGAPQAAAPPLMLKVHRSNFAMVGFVEEVEIAALVALAATRKERPMVVFDLGTGLLVPGAALGLRDEPDVPSAIAAGADVVVFSGDKLLGGPQAGIVVGSKEAIAAMRAHPLMRAVRAGKLVLAALDATLAVYERGLSSALALPALAAIAAPREVVHARAERLRALLGEGDVVDSIARVGGGAQPLATIASAALRLPDADPERLAAQLRRGTPALIGRIEAGALLLDPRTLSDEELAMVVASIRAARAALSMANG